MSEWVPLLEFALKRGISLSTLRRRIKANKIRYRLDQGRYLIWDGEPGDHMANTGIGATSAALPAQLPNHLIDELKRAQEEISELKMLVALYEEKLHAKNP